MPASAAPTPLRAAVLAAALACVGAASAQATSCPLTDLARAEREHGGDLDQADTLMRLVNLAETDEERVRRLRDVVAVTPSPLNLEFLATAVDAERSERLRARAARDYRVSAMLGTTVDRARAAGEANRFGETLSAAMTTAAGSGRYLDMVDSAWRHKFELALERHAGSDAVSRLRETESVITVE